MLTDMQNKEIMYLINSSSPRWQRCIFITEQHFELRQFENFCSWEGAKMAKRGKMKLN